MIKFILFLSWITVNVAISYLSCLRAEIESDIYLFIIIIYFITLVLIGTQTLIYIVIDSIIKGIKNARGN